MSHSAAVLTGVDTPLEVRDDVELAEPKAGEVRIKMGASGVCHSDLSVQNGTIPLPTPIVLGHEGAGEVQTPVRLPMPRSVPGVSTVPGHTEFAVMPCFPSLRARQRARLTIPALETA